MHAVVGERGTQAAVAVVERAVVVEPAATARLCELREWTSEQAIATTTANAKDLFRF